MKEELTNLSDYLYDLPGELIAQTPLEPRDSSRLMVVDRAKGEISEIVFRELADFLQEGDSLVFNDTKVIPARLIGKKPSGAKIEVFLLEKECGSIWSALVKPGKKAPPGTTIAFSDTFECAVLEDVADGVKKIEFSFDGDFEPHLLKHGKMPLPPYIRRDSSLQDSSCYQTVFAKNTGAVAAPTAGLHFTPEVLESLSAKGVLQTHITLHVGLGTFRPVQTEDIRKHVMHKERYEITPEAAAQLNARVKDRRQICVGTTCCRTLEFAVDRAGVIQPGIGSADIFIYPGYRFKYVNSLLTNFHLPGSTLLMLVSAFAGHELTREAYERAVKERYRFFSYGDAMLIL